MGGLLAWRGRLSTAQACRLSGSSCLIASEFQHDPERYSGSQARDAAAGLTALDKRLQPCRRVPNCVTKRS